jgi:DNA-binding transcriptional LysR family regulator
MFDWDDIRIFLSATRTGTIRGAARDLAITHATVSRRLHGLEEKLGAKLFERTVDGTTLSAAGHAIMETALKVEREMATIDRQVFAQDTRMAGIVRLSIHDILFHSILHTSLRDFQKKFPMIELEINATGRLANLAQREADLVVRITKKPPESAVGRKLAASPLACFASKAYLKNRPKLDRWVKLTYGPSETPPTPARTVVTVDSAHATARLIADGVGMGTLPCFFGDDFPGLYRVPETDLVPDLDLWVLVHADLRKTPRVRALLDHLYETLEDAKDLIEGRRPKPLNL